MLLYSSFCLRETTARDGDDARADPATSAAVHLDQVHVPEGRDMETVTDEDQADGPGPVFNQQKIRLTVVAQDNLRLFGVVQQQTGEQVGRLVGEMGLAGLRAGALRLDAQLRPLKRTVVAQRQRLHVHRHGQERRAVVFLAIPVQESRRQTNFRLQAPQGHDPVTFLEGRRRQVGSVDQTLFGRVSHQSKSIHQIFLQEYTAND